MTAAIEEKFCQAFNSVWNQLPGADRWRLLAYWRGEIGPVLVGEGFPPPEHRPVIRVFLSETTEPLGWDWAGTILNFSATLVLDQPERLPLVIARALAAAYRFAAGRHCGLILERFDGPLEVWEKERGGEFTEAEHEAIQDALEGDFRRAYEAEIMDLLRRWKFEEPQAVQGVGGA